MPATLAQPCINQQPYPGGVQDVTDSTLRCPTSNQNTLTACHHLSPQQHHQHPQGKETATQLHHLNTACRMSMDTSPNSQNGGQSFYTQPPPLSNPPPRIFGNISTSGSPIPPTLPGPIFTNDDGSVENDGEQGDPKRRRIARVCCLLHTKLLLLTRAYRHAICVERKKSSVTANFQPVRIARIIRQSVSLRR